MGGLVSRCAGRPLSIPLNPLHRFVEAAGDHPAETTFEEPSYHGRSLSAAAQWRFRVTEAPFRAYESHWGAFAPDRADHWRPRKRLWRGIQGRRFASTASGRRQLARGGEAESSSLRCQPASGVNVLSMRPVTPGIVERLIPTKVHLKREYFCTDIVIASELTSYYFQF